MDLIVLVLLLCVIGFVVWYLTTKIPMPPFWATGIDPTRPALVGMGAGSAVFGLAGSGGAGGGAAATGGAGRYQRTAGILARMRKAECGTVAIG